MSEENKIEEDFKIEDPDFVSKFDRSVGQPTLDLHPRDTRCGDAGRV